jgi:SNF2 family DNA or RNA helicase
MDLQFVYLNGDVPAIQRKTIIEQFRDDKNLRVFLSTDAGGVGVNLQQANILINIDLPWNPAVLEQRIGRIYRLGQKKKIQVFNFISAYSIEHRILQLLEFKKSVFAGVLEEQGEDQVMIEGFMKSIQNLLNVDLNQRNDSLPKYTREREEILQVAEESAAFEKVPTDNTVPNGRDITRQNNGSEASSSPVPKTGLRGRIRKWFNSVLSLFNHR